MFDWVKIETDEQIKELCELANEIWNEYSICFISKEQIDYMLEKFQSFEAVKKQINGTFYCEITHKPVKMEYYFLEEDGENIGYFGIQEKPDCLFLSKIYIKKAFRSKGYARKAFNQAIVERAKELEKPKIQLTVNKYNIPAICVYEQIGFDRIKSVETNIGNGYIMDDYIYEFQI